MEADQIPPVLLGKALRLWLQNRVVFPKCETCKVVREEEPFKIFRKVMVLQKDHQPKIPGAFFKVKFLFAKFSFDTNRRLSLIPIPFIIAQPGFISKTWLVGTETGCFQGLYEWVFLDAAEKYVDSFPLKLMRKRAVPGSLQIEVKEISPSQE